MSTKTDTEGFIEALGAIDRAADGELEAQVDGYAAVAGFLNPDEGLCPYWRCGDDSPSVLAYRLGQRVRKEMQS